MIIVLVTVHMCIWDEWLYAVIAQVYVSLMKEQPYCIAVVADYAVSETFSSDEL